MSEAVAEIGAVLPDVTEDEGAVRRAGCWRALLYLLVFSPLLVLGIAVANCAVDMPILDDWERGEMWRRYFAGALDFQYMYSPHIEHRALFPRLITLAYGVWFGGDLRLEIWTTFALVAGTCLLCFRLLRHTLGGGWALWPAAFLTNLLLCCPVQYPDFLWASMVAFMLPFFCLAGILVLGIARLPTWVKFLLSVLLAELGTHSFSQGLILWPVAICLPLFHTAGFGTGRGRFIYAGAMLLVAALTLVPYFTWHPETTSDPSHTYSSSSGERTSHLEKLTQVLQDPKPAREYFFKALGNPLVRVFSRDPSAAARDVGRVLFVLFLAAMGFLFWRRRDAVTWDRLVPWAAAGFFALTVAALLAVGRTAMASDRSTMPRYIPMTIFLVVALVAITAYAVQLWAAVAPTRKARARRAAWGCGLGAALALLLTNLWVYGLFKMLAWRDSRLEARAVLPYINLFEPEKVGRLDNTLEFVRRQAAVMSRHGLLRPPLAERWGFEPFIRRARVLGGDTAELRYSAVDGGRVLVAGFAVLPAGRVCDGVLISVRADGDPDWRVIGFAEARSAHVPHNIFIDDHFGDGHDLSQPKDYAGFVGAAELPEPLPDGFELQCWALDAKTFEAYAIGEPVAK